MASLDPFAHGDQQLGDPAGAWQTQVGAPDWDDDRVGLDQATCVNGRQSRRPRVIFIVPSAKPKDEECARRDHDEHGDSYYQPLHG